MRYSAQLAKNAATSGGDGILAATEGALFVNYSPEVWGYGVDTEHVAELGTLLLSKAGEDYLPLLEDVYGAGEGQNLLSLFTEVYGVGAIEDICAYTLCLASPDIASTLKGYNGSTFGSIADALTMTLGTSGMDVITGGEGNDVIIAGPTSLTVSEWESFWDVLQGGGGNDILVGSIYRDELSGGEGDDLLIGGGSSDIIRGGDGADTLLAFDGTIAIGGAGDDTFLGGNGSILSGGDGNETFKLAAGGLTAVWGGAGSDVFDFASGTKVTILSDIFLTDQAFEQLQMDALYAYFVDNNLVVPDVVLFNVDGSDILKIDGVTVGSPGHTLLLEDSEETNPDGIHDYAMEYFGYVSGGQYLVPVNPAGAWSMGSEQVGDALNIFSSFVGELQLAPNGPMPLPFADLSLHIEGFVNGAFGISFTNAPAYNVYNGYIDPLTLNYSEGYLDGWGEDDFSEVSVKNLLPPGSTELVEGTDGNDTLAGTGGDDNIQGHEGNDTISGGDGSDVLYAGAGNDTVNGGNGDDQLIAGGGEGDDLYDGGDGVDRITFHSTSLGVVVDLELGFASGTEVGSDELDSIENVSGGSGADVLTGSDGDNVIDGRRGNDLLEGRGGNDELYGGAGSDTVLGGQGNDVLEGGVGNDLLDGGAGNDTYYFWSTDGHDTLNDTDLGDGADVAWLGGVDWSTLTAARDGDDLVLSYGGDGEGLLRIKDQFSAGDDAGVETLHIYDTDSNTHSLSRLDLVALAVGNGVTDIRGTRFADHLVAGDVATELHGGAGVDRLQGGSAQDILAGGADVDLLEGNAGADTYLYTRGDGMDILVEIDDAINSDNLTLVGIDALDTVTFAVDGYDLVVAVNESSPGAGDGGSVRVKDQFNPSGTFGIETISDSFSNVWTRAEILDAISAGNGRSVTGTAGEDYLAGTRFDDSIEGDDGDDVLVGGAGADAHDGGNGIDTVTYQMSTSGIYLDLGGPSLANSGDARGDTFSSLEIIKGTNFADTIAVSP